MAEFPILLDTDIGSDIDDAIALLYLLMKPGSELLGITTVTGDVQKRAAIAEWLCRTVHRPEIPIHCGRREVLLTGPGQPDVPQYQAIAHLNLELNRPENTAVPFLREQIRARPHEITLLTIGPFSNVALLFAMDPEIPFLLKSLVSMAGFFFNPDCGEWNCRCDPTAASMVYRAPRRHHISVGLDVTMQCKLSREEFRDRFAAEPFLSVARLAEAWFAHSGEVTFHDPLAAALLFEPGLCRYLQGTVRIHPSSDQGIQGYTELTEGPGPDQVAFSVDPSGFFDEFFSVCY